jgi:excinuclease UvrABC helicase subunit UvrB
VRLGCEINAYESVMEEAGIIMDDIEKPRPEAQDDVIINKGNEDTSLDMLDIEALEDLLQEAIDNEDYQRAAQIRDEINGRV